MESTREITKSTCHSWKLKKTVVSLAQRGNVGFLRYLRDFELVTAVESCVLAVVIVIMSNADYLYKLGAERYLVIALVG